MSTNDANKSNAVKSCVRVEENGKALKNMAKVLQDVHDAWPTDTSPELRSIVADIASAIPPTVDDMLANARITSPVGKAAPWIMKRSEKDSKRKRIEQGLEPQQEESSPFEQFNAHKQNLEGLAKKSQHAKLPAATRKKLYEEKLNAFFQSHQPSNGSKFQCMEAMSILDEAVAQSIKPTHVIRHWDHNKLIPVCHRYCQSLFEKHKQNQPVKWGGTARDGSNRGQKELVATEPFLAACKEFLDTQNRSLYPKDVREIMTKLMNEGRDESSGEEPQPTISRRSVGRYLELAAAHMNVKLTNPKVKSKAKAPYIEKQPDHTTL